MSGALQGIRIIDFGQYLAGPLAAMLLEDAGADVVRVDPPGGPRWPHPANSILQRGKRSIVLDLKEAEDHRIAEQLIGSADVVIENFRPGVMDRLGLGPSHCRAAHPGLIYCSIPGFASDDARRDIAAYEGIVAAAAGLYLPGTWDGSNDPPPVFNPIPLASNFGAIRAAETIAAALIVRERDGIGQQIEVPLFDAMVGLTRELERDGLLDESQLWSNGVPTEELRRCLAAVFKTRPAAEWTRLANPAADLSDCLTTQEWLHSEPHARSSGAVISLVYPELGRTVQAGVAFTMSKTPPDVESPRHRLDADREEIVAELALTPRPLPEGEGAELAFTPRPLPEGEGAPRAPLDGIRVIDTTQILAGPTCGRILAEFGAQVIKLNAPVGHPIMGHAWLNSGKRSLLLDLKAPDGREVLDRLLATTDVFLMNFAPRSAERLGVAEAAVRQQRPDIIYTCVSCYGWDGPRGTFRGHEQMGQAVTGMQERWGRDLRIPVMQSMPICDLGTGNLAAFATLLALFHRMRTGEGQFVSASLAHTATFHQIPFMLDYDGRCWEADPSGQHQRGLGPQYRMYRAKDRWFFVAAHVVLAPHEVMETPYPLLKDDDVPGLGAAVVAGPSGRLSATPVRRTAQPRPPGGDNADILGELGMGHRLDELTASGVVANEVRSTLNRPG